MIPCPRPPIDQRCIRCLRRGRVRSEWCAECWEIVAERCIRCLCCKRVRSEWCAECWEIVADETTEAPA